MALSTGMVWVTKAEPTTARKAPATLGEGTRIMLARILLPELVTLINAAEAGTVQLDARSLSIWMADRVPPGLARAPMPKVARRALAEPEMVPGASIDSEMCAPLIVPPVAAATPVTTENARSVSPEPVEVKVSF